MKTFLIIEGEKAIKNYLKEFKSILKTYKDEFKGWGYTLKKVQPKNAKKPYWYWYRWVYDNETQNNKWEYIGREKPDSNIPDPPKSILDEAIFQEVGGNVLISETELEKVKEIFEGYQKFEVTPS